MTTGLKEVALASTRTAHPSLPHSLHSRGQDGPHGPVLRRDAAPVPKARGRASLACQSRLRSLRAGPRLPLHGLGAGPRREAPVLSTAASVRSRRSSPGAGAWTTSRRTRSCGCRWSGASRRSSSPSAKDDLTTLLAACNPQTYVGSRMRAMILFLLDTGVRSSELVSIELCDVLFAEGRVRVLQWQGT